MRPWSELHFPVDYDYIIPYIDSNGNVSRTVRFIITPIIEGLYKLKKQSFLSDRWRTIEEHIIIEQLSAKELSWELSKCGYIVKKGGEAQ